MILSDRFGFLFVANLRTASSSLQAALRPIASVEFSDTSQGKHLTLAEIHEKFLPGRLAHLYTWGVIRDPVEWLWSLYAFHQRAGFDDKPHSTKGLTFEAWYGGDTHRWMRVPQSSRFADHDGEYGLDFLVRHERLAEGFSFLKFRLGLPNLLLPVTNTSRPVPGTISPSMRRRIRADYEWDYETIARYGERERTAGGFVGVFARPSSP